MKDTHVKEPAKMEDVFLQPVTMAYKTGMKKGLIVVGATVRRAVDVIPELNGHHTILRADTTGLLMKVPGLV